MPKRVNAKDRTAAGGEGSHRSCNRSQATRKIFGGSRTKYKDYYEFLEELGYATDPEYINKLKKIEAWIQQYQDTKK